MAKIPKEKLMEVLWEPREWEIQDLAADQELHQKPLSINIAE
jgi:hypothetical protein